MLVPADYAPAYIIYLNIQSSYLPLTIVSVEVNISIYY